MNLALVDDLEYDLHSLEKLITDYFFRKNIKYNISLFLTGEEFLSSFRPGRFDAIFLDNLLDGINGMDVARRVRSQDDSVPIIFITAEDGFALEGYTVQAMDYIMKPVSKERLEILMKRLDKRLNKSRNIIEIKENRVTRFLNLDDVLYVRSAGHFLEIQTSYGTLKPYMTQEYFQSVLKELGEYGTPSQGLRFQNCCRGYVVGLDHVISLDSTDFLMSDGSRVPISRPKYKEMQNAYANYLFQKTRNTID